MRRAIPFLNANISSTPTVLLHGFEHVLHRTTAVEREGDVRIVEIGALTIKRVRVAEDVVTTTDTGIGMMKVQSKNWQ